jgi:hypothetical protein
MPYLAALLGGLWSACATAADPTPAAMPVPGRSPSCDFTIALENRRPWRRRVRGVDDLLAE